MFTWSTRKAALNRLSHGVSFEEAQEAFSDPYGVEEYDYAHSVNEHRFNLIGKAACGLLFVVFSNPNEQVIHIISARLAEDYERRIYEQNFFESSGLEE